MISYSQYKQDIYCYDNFFKGYLEGTYLEIGADDGIDKSNTFFYEKLGWTGMCVEPSPSRFELLKKNRNCICEDYAIYDKKESIEFLDIAGWGKGLSGIIENYDSRHLRRIDKEIQHPDNRGCQIIAVQCISINELLKKHQIFKIDFCTIDTEGGELGILKSLDLDRFTVDVICVENNYEYPRIRDFMHSVGYEMVAKLEIDEVYRRT